MNNLINILYTEFKNPLSNDKFRDYTNQIPISLKNKTFRYRKWNNKHSHLFGKLLLMENLRIINGNKTTLNDLKYTEYDRPYFNSDIDFNISHSSDYVLCAIAQGMRIGVDIERKKKLEIEHFKKKMSTNQWNEITSSSNPDFLFLKYWTMKESMAKANGRGLNISFSEISFTKNIAKYKDERWYLSELPIDNNYFAFVASSIKYPTIKIRKINFH